jgi:PAS domain S-box-containing protein
VLILDDLSFVSSPGFAEVDQAVLGGLQNSPYQIELYHESLQVTFFPDEVSQRRLREGLIAKYSERKPDLIIAAGSASLKFIAESPESFIRDTPIIFCAVGEVPDRLNSHIHFTGVLAKLHPAETLSAALRLFPGTKHVLVVGGMGKFDEQWEGVAKQAFQNYESKLEFTYLTDLAMPVLLERLRQLPSNTIVYHTSFTQDVTGERFIDSAQAVPLEAGAANAPIFVMDDVDLRAGTVGGDLVNWANDGHVAADMAVRILNGEKPEDIPVVMSNHAYMFDWRALKRWGLKVSDLPPGSIVLNREPSIWEIYKRYIVAGVLLLIVQAVIIFALLWQRSKRRKVEKDLVRTNERLHLAMESGKSVGWSLDIKSGQTIWFGDLSTMFGMNAETFVGQVEDFYRYIHPEDRQRVWEAVSKSRQNHEPYCAEFRVLWPDGTIRWVDDRGEHEYTKNGEPQRIAGMAVDITDRKQMEEAVRKSEEKFSKAFRESPVAFTLTSTNDHRYIEVNETFQRLSGWKRGEVIGRTPLDIEIWADPNQRIEFIKRLLAERSVRDLEAKFRTKDGRIRAGLGSGELIELNGEQCALFVFADITEVKQAEEVRRLSEQRFSQFFSTLPEYCYMTSSTGDVLDVNPAACEALGYTKEELLGKPLSGLYAPESALKLVNLLEKWKRTGKLYNEEMVVLTKEGVKRTVLLNAGAVKDSQGNIIYVASVQTDITERKEILLKLRESQDRVKGIVESAMDAIIAVDEEQQIIIFNAAAEKMFGCRVQDAIGSSINRFIPERFPAAHEVDIRRFGETGVPNRAAWGTLCGLRSTGEEFPIEASISQAEAGGKKLFTVIIRDITERKQAEEARFRHAAIVESSDDAIISLDLGGVIRSWNIGAQRMYGYTELEALGQPMTIIIPPELREEQEKLLQRLKTGARIVHYDTVRRAKDGTRIDVSLTISPLRDSAGKIFGVAKIARNITLSKKAEAALRESEERFRLVANAAPVMIWMSGPDKLCTYFNQPWLEFTGRSIRAELGNGWAENVHPEDLDGCLKNYNNAFDGRKQFKMEYRLRRHDGEYRWILDLGVPRFQRDGSFAGYIGTCIDVTDRKLAEESVANMGGKLIEAHEQERTWIARELHDDINQRITLALLNLERVQVDSSPLAPAITQRLTEIKEHLTSVASDLQALSHRLHSSKLEYLGLVTAAGSFCGELSEEHGVEIAFHSESIPKDLPLEIALCFFRVLQESLQNAVKHSGSKHFEVWLKGSPNEIELTVRDPGLGFDVEEAIRGRGLGLTSMKERLKLVHGRLSIESRLAQGTTIRATMPFSSSAKAAGA